MYMSNDEIVIRFKELKNKKEQYTERLEKAQKFKQEIADFIRNRGGIESKRLYKPDTESVGSRGSRDRNGKSYSNTNTDYLKERV